MFNIINLTKVETLMDEIKKYPVNTLLTAIEQTKGRGKDNRVWESRKSSNLYFTLSIKSGRFDSCYSFLTGLAMLETLKIFKVNGLNLKWPNDVLLNNKKFCGILLEKNTDLLYIGVGINIDYYPNNTNFKATSLENEGYIIEKNKLLDCFLTKFMELSQELNNFGFKTIKDRWLEYAYNLNNEIKIKINFSEYFGVFEGIDDDGAILLKNNKDTIKFYSADVFDI